MMAKELGVLLKQIDAKKTIVAKFDHSASAIKRDFLEWVKIEQTYNSNAIEGNTLSRKETAEVGLKGLTIAGKSIVEHLEVINHIEAFEYMFELSGDKKSKIIKRDVLLLHQIILWNIDQSNAGIYRTVDVRISGSDVVLSSHLKIEEEMVKLIKYMNSSHKLHPVLFAAQVHLRFVTIHPFIDGNGRTARLLMNLLLIKEGYPITTIYNKNRTEYIECLEYAQLSNDESPFNNFIARKVLEAYRQYPSQTSKKINSSRADGLMKIGELSKITSTPVSTLRFWTDKGLLEVSEISKSRYRYYDSSAIKRVKQITKLQNDRLTIMEIQQKLSE